MHGIRSTRGTLATWNHRPGPVLGTGIAGGLVAAIGLLGVVWVISQHSSGAGSRAVVDPE